MTVIATGLDYSARRLSGASIRAAGHRFVCRYLWFPGQGHVYLTADECRDLIANGIEAHGVYEQNTNDPAGGWNAGVAMGRQAVQSARAAGLPPGATVFFCADAWLSAHGVPVSTAMSFLDGARSQIDPAGFVLGAYGFADFVFAAHDGGHADRFWLCGAEIPDDHRPGWLHMYQRNYRTNPTGPDVLDGVGVDINDQYLPMGSGAEARGDDDMPMIAKGDVRKDDAYIITATPKGIFKRWIRSTDELGFYEATGAKVARVSQAWLDGIWDYVEDDAVKILDELAELKADVAELKASGIPVEAKVDWAEGAKVINDDADARNRDDNPATGRAT